MRPLEAMYEGTRAGVTAFLRGTGPDLERVGARALPACPSWTVKDVVAHLAGLCTDVVAGNVAGAATEEWTAAQVSARRDRTLADLLAEWEAAGRRLSALVDDLPLPYGSQVVGDVTVHEHDIRGALGDRGARSSPAVAACTDFVVSCFVRPAAQAHGVPALEILSGGRRWVVGRGAHPVGRVEADAFELFRAVTGRRSPRQVEAFAWTVDPGPYLGLFGLPPFTPRQTDLAE